MTLRHVLGSSYAESRDFFFGNIIGDCQRFESCQRSDQAMNLVLLNQLLRLGARGGRNTCRIGHDQFGLAARERVVAFLQEH